MLYKFKGMNILRIQNTRKSIYYVIVLVVFLVMLLGVKPNNSYHLITNQNTQVLVPQSSPMGSYWNASKDKKEEQTRYIERIHRAAPGVNWKKIIAETRNQKYLEAFK